MKSLIKLLTNFIKFQEVMVYKNLFYRTIFSLILFSVYIVSLTNINLLLILGTIIYLIIFYESFNFFKNFLHIILLYVLLSLICFYIYFFYFFNLYYFNILLSVIIIFDSFSYFTGILFGKIYIFKKISPKKTIEGYMGGVFFTNLILLSYLIITDNLLDIKSSIILINFIIFFSIIGDLFQSFLKRINKIKNSSSYLPGHGGFFDRFDSFLPAIIFLLFYNL